MRLIDADELKKLYEPYKGLRLKVPCEVICLNIEDQPTIQPQGIDKDRLIEALVKYEYSLTDNTIITIDDKAYRGMRNALVAVRNIINQQPITDVPDTNVGEIPQSYKDRLLKELMRTDHLNYYDYDIGAYIQCIPVYAVIHIINQQPTTDGWIPVSSGKLPSETECVLVTTCYGEVNEVSYKDRWCYGDEMYEWYDDDEVIAWQPLPQPYKESE